MDSPDEHNPSAFRHFPELLRSDPQKAALMARRYLSEQSARSLYASSARLHQSAASDGDVLGAQVARHLEELADLKSSEDKA